MVNHRLTGAGAPGATGGGGTVMCNGLFPTPARAPAKNWLQRRVSAVVMAGAWAAYGRRLRLISGG